MAIEKIGVAWIIEKGQSRRSCIPVITQFREVEGRNVRDTETEISFENEAGLFEAKGHFLGEESNLVGNVLIVQCLAISLPSNRGLSHRVHGDLHGVEPKSTEVADRPFTV